MMDLMMLAAKTFPREMQAEAAKEAIAGYLLNPSEDTRKDMTLKVDMLHLNLLMDGKSLDQSLDEVKDAEQASKVMRRLKGETN